MGVSRRIPIVLIEFLILFQFSTALTHYGRCLSPQLERAFCIELQDCKYLFGMLQKPNLSGAELEYLMKSQCGNYMGKVLVCCPDNLIYTDYVPTSQPTIATESRYDVDLLPNPPNCGRMLIDRIYGGNLTSIDEFPWMALISYTKPNGVQRFNCGGTLINNRYVITAAHCIPTSKSSTSWQIDSVRLGEWDLTTNPDCEIDSRNQKDCAPEHIDVEIEEIITHPQYVLSSRNQLYDIALLRLKRSVTESHFIRPVCLPKTSNRNTNYHDKVMDVAGWGRTETSDVSAVKLKATVNGWQLNPCQDVYRKHSIQLDSSQICAGGKEGVDSCRGDSGGPLTVEQEVNNRMINFLVGIVSFGPTPCGLKNWPGVYTKVSAYIDWIQQNVRA